MCGLVGYITTERVRGANARTRFLTQGLIVDTLRGEDSTGAFFVPHDGPKGASADWCKIPDHGYALVATKEYQSRTDTTSLGRIRAAIGHNRSATVGTVTIDNAHPFQEGPVTLVHNGTLYTTSGLGASMHDLKSEGVEVDSHVICHNLALAEDPADVISKLDGAFALIWHDARDDSINIVRNEKRPLHMMFATCEDTVLIASEAEMLHWLATRNNFTEAPIAYLKSGELLKFLPGSTVPEVRTVPLYVPAPVTRPGRWYGNGGASRQSGTTSGGAPWSQPYPKLSQQAELALLEFDLDGETDLKFCPTSVDSVPSTGCAVVRGTMSGPDTPDMKAIVYGLTYEAVKTAASYRETWTVSALAVRHEDEPVIVCKLRERQWREKPGDVVPERKLGDRRGGRKDYEYVPGPHDEWLPVHEWMRHTADGCVQCAQVLLADEAEEIMWVQGGSRPLCPECADENATALRRGYN